MSDDPVTVTRVVVKRINWALSNAATVQHTEAAFAKRQAPDTAILRPIGVARPGKRRIRSVEE
jgi:hypothetical protein